MTGLAVAAAISAGCSAGTSASASNDGGASGGTINLVAYSTPEVVYDRLIPLFQKTDAGKGTKFTESYGGSGDQSRAVGAGQPADYVHFALSPDIDRLVDDGLVDPNWADNQHKGIVSESVVVFVVRKGNPKGIKTWDDLVKPGVEVITPNPFSSGGARWNIMAAYGAERHEGKSDAEAISYLNELFHHVPVQDDKASAALQTFVGGKGDVLLSYENEAILAQDNGEPVDYVVPDSTILIQTPAAVTSNSENPEVAKKFLDFVYTPEAQKVFAETGYRPVVESVFDQYEDTFPIPSDLFTIDDLGGWDAVTPKFFDPDSSVMQKIEQDLGVPTS
ncbi:MAG TPA: sulfate ABC transporter substrate-binding protein [Gaiellaceae bacterium]